MEKGYTKKKYRRKIPKTVRWYDKHRNEDKTFDKSKEDIMEKGGPGSGKRGHKTDKTQMSLAERYNDLKSTFKLMQQSTTYPSSEAKYKDLKRVKDELDRVGKLLGKPQGNNMEKGRGPDKNPRKKRGMSSVGEMEKDPKYQERKKKLYAELGGKPKAGTVAAQEATPEYQERKKKLYAELKGDKKLYAELKGDKKMKKSEIEQEIENMSKSMEESHIDPVELVIQTIEELGPEGLKKAMPDLTVEQKATLESVLVDMKKSMDFDTVTPDKKMTKLENSGAELEDGSDDEDEKVAQAADSNFKHQGGSDDNGAWNGQVIKSVDEMIDETLEKGYGMKKMMDKKDVKDMAEKEAKEEVKEHKDKMHKKDMKKMCKSELIAIKDEIIKSYEDAGLAWNNELIKSEMKKRMLKEEDQVEMGGQDKGGKADRADKNAPDDIKVAKEACATADDPKCNPAKMKKSVVYEKDENSLLKAKTLGRNHHFSINNYYDEAIRKSAESGEEVETLEKSESEYDINDLIEKGMDSDADTYMTNHILENQKLGGEFKKSFSDKDMEKACGMKKADKDEEEKKKKEKTISMGVRG